MSDFQFIKTVPNDENYHLFNEAQHQLYDEVVNISAVGIKPVEQHLHACYVLMQNTKPVGRFAIYNNPHLQLEGKKVICIGSYECIEDDVIAKRLLDRAKAIAKELGAEIIIGPMEGSTWNNYRFSLHNKYPNFLMEPYHHSYYNKQFIDYGFTTIASYTSQIEDVKDANKDVKRDLSPLEKRYAERGLIVRDISLTAYEEELYNIAVFSNLGFSDNYLFSPIKPEDFVAKYASFKNFIKPELILIAETSDKEVKGVVFCIHDYTDTAGKTVIVKSMARTNDIQYRGIGSFMIQKVYERFFEMGYTKIIHAFMIEGNESVNVSNKYNGQAYKNYALYGLSI